MGDAGKRRRNRGVSDRIRAAFVFLVTAWTLVGGLPTIQAASAAERQQVGIEIEEINIAAGRYRLVFSVPEEVELGAGKQYIRVVESRRSDAQGAAGDNEEFAFAVLETTENMQRQVPATYEYRAQICNHLPERQDECGPLSASQAVAIAAGLRLSVPKESEQHNTIDATAGAGPAVIASGIYSSTRTKMNAWHFNWANHLRFPVSGDALPPEFFDLAIRWQTYEYSPVLDRTIPIWLWAQLKLSRNEPGFYEGVLYFRERLNGAQEDINVGQIRVDPVADGETSDPDATVMDIRWRTDRWTMYGGGQDPGTWVDDTLQFSTAAGEPGANPMPHDSFSGDWNDDPYSDPDQRVSLLFWIENQVERIDVLFNDQAGQPVWALASRHNNSPDPITADPEGFCAFTVFDGPLPNVELAPDWSGGQVVPLGCDPGSPSSVNLRRNFDAIEPGARRTGSLWADLRLPAFRPGRLRYASASSPGTIRKFTRFHDIRPVIGGVDGATRCVIDNGSSCEVNLRWLLDGTYPEASVYVKSLPHGTPTRVFTGIAHDEDLSAPVPLQPGEYEFQIRRTADSGSDLIARSRAVTVLSDDVDRPDDPAPEPSLTADVQSERTGATRGEFRVDESGSASFRIPVMTAPSGGGTALRIALAYHARAGNDIAGLGWSLDGVGAITRCSKTLETDGETGGVTITSGDRFCLDGQRLVMTSGDRYGADGAEYRLEVDNIVRIRSFGDQGGGPAYFKAWRKDGTVTWYGATEREGADSGNSRVSSKLNGSRSPVWRWNIGRVEDSAGNFMRFVWGDQFPTGAQVESLLQAVEYSGHVDGSVEEPPINRIDFEYEDRPASDRADQFVAGARLARTQRLQRIVSAAEGNELRRYNLTYWTAGDGTGRSVLRSVTECNGSVCFPPTQFDWYRGPFGLGELTTGQSPAFSLSVSQAENLAQTLPADINGDGLADLVFVFRRPGSVAPVVSYRLAQGSTGGPIRLGALQTGPAMGGSVASSDPVIPDLRVIDLNADGYNDVLYAVAGEATGAPRTDFYAHLWNPQSRSLAPARQVGHSESVRAGGMRVLDWDGDGLSDIVYTEGGDLRVARNTGYSSSQPGATLVEDQTFDVELARSHFPEPPGPSELGEPVLNFIDAEVFDANGDGRADLVLAVKEAYTDCEAAQIDLSECNDPLAPQPIDPGPVIKPDPVVEPPPAKTSSKPGTGFRTTGTDDVVDGSGRRIQGRYILFELQRDSVSGDFRYRSTAFIARTDDDDAGGLFRRAAEIRVADLNADGLADFVYYDELADRWYFRLNRGLSTPGSERLVSQWPGGRERARRMQLRDVNGDDHPDAIFPTNTGSGSATWQVSLWDWSRGSDHYYRAPVPTTAGSGNLENGAGSLFTDFNGDGKLDQMLFVPDQSGVKFRFGRGVNASGSASAPAYLLRKITDGFGAWTELVYKPLTDPAVYRRGTAGASRTAAGSVVYDVIAPIYVVASATSLSPQVSPARAIGSAPDLNGTTRVEYFYGSARIAGGGRGFLGFGEVASYDVRSGTLTRTRYRQDFPFIGLPETTRRWYLSRTPWPSTGAPTFPAWVEGSCTNSATRTGNSLGCSENTWASRDTSIRSAHPYLGRSEEWSFTPKYSSGTMTGTEFTHRVVTENSNVDQYGNVGNVTVSTYTSASGTGNAVARQETVNTYANDELSWHLGRLTCTKVTSSRPGDPGVGDEVRYATFGYDSDTGILTRETVDASSCNDTRGSLKTVYDLDDFGNRETTTVTGADIGPARKTRSFYDSHGRYVETEMVWLENAWRTTRHVEKFDRYGNATVIEDGRGVTTKADFDRMGRPHYTYTPDGAWTRTLHRTGRGAHCPVGTAAREEITAGDGSESWICKDRLGRETRTIVWGFEGERIYIDTRYDFASRPIDVSEPYKAGATAFWTRTDYDEIGRVEFVRLPDGNTESWHYSLGGSGVGQGIETRHTDARGNVHTVWRNALGEKIAETAADGGQTEYRYDALGQLIETDGPLPNDTIVIEYDDLGHKKQLADPDKGTWRYRHNALGELVCQIDAKGQGTAIEYDELGRRIARYDRTGVSNPSTCAGNEVGRTTWTYGNTPGVGSFGQVRRESSQYDDGIGIGHTTTRNHNYDALGRRDRTETTISEAGGFARSYVESTTWDAHGRVFQRFDAAGGGRGVQFDYNARGYLQALREARGGQAYWQVQAQSARGQVTEAEFGNGMVVTALHDPATGRLLERTDGDGHALVQALALGWDEVGNLKRRHDLGGLRDQLETYDYDSRDRLEQVQRSIEGSPLAPVQRLRYDRSGNIVCKSDVSATSCTGTATNYAYGAGTAGVHAATSAGGRTFEFDANGNVIRDREGGFVDREFDYTSYDKLRRIERDGRAVEFHYGADRARTLKRELEGATVTRRTHYVGSVEVVWDGAFPGAGSGQYRRSIGGVAIATYFEASGVDRQRYVHRDHQGSITAITDESGRIVAQSGFDAWGQRRSGWDWTRQWRQWAMGMTTPGWAAALLAITPRGFTGHEHVDEMGVIHMNGRIYDPHLGRFLQADPFVEDTTTLNRYTYVHNNPLTLVDPSGFFSFKKALGIVARVVQTLDISQTTRLLIEIGFRIAQAVRIVRGAVGDGRLAGALPGAFASAAPGARAPSAQPVDTDRPDRARPDVPLASVVPWLDSGVLGTVASGRRGHAFAAAGVGDIQFQRHPRDVSAEIAAQASLAGTDSAVTDDKFANGAGTKAFEHAEGGFFRRSVSRLLSTGETAFRFAVFDFREPLGGSYLLEAVTVIPAFKVLKLGRAAKVARRARATRGAGQVFERVVSNAELQATRRTGLLRGGREGENFFTNSASLDAKRAQQRLGLDGPLRDARIRFRIKNGAEVTGPRTAPGGRTGTTGGGREFSTLGRTEIEILRVDPLRK